MNQPNPPAPASATLLHALTAHREGDDLKAVALLTVAIQSGEGGSAARLLRGQILGAMGQWREAEADAAAVLADEKGNADAAWLLASAQAATGATQAAADTLRSLLLDAPRHRPAILLLGRIYAAGGQADKALQLFDEAIAAQPDFAEAYHARGGVKHRLHDEAGAAEDLRTALRLDPALARSFDGSYSLLDDSLKAPGSCLNRR